MLLHISLFNAKRWRCIHRYLLRTNIASPLECEGLPSLYKTFISCIATLRGSNKSEGRPSHSKAMLNSLYKTFISCIATLRGSNKSEGRPSHSKAMLNSLYKIFISCIATLRGSNIYDVYKTFVSCIATLPGSNDVFCYIFRMI